MAGWSQYGTGHVALHHASHGSFIYYDDEMKTIFQVFLSKSSARGSISLYEALQELFVLMTRNHIPDHTEVVSVILQFQAG